jgi:hypothetical protein
VPCVQDAREGEGAGLPDIAAYVGGGGGVGVDGGIACAVEGGGVFGGEGEADGFAAVPCCATLLVWGGKRGWCVRAAYSCIGSRGRRT